ncbi:MAG: transporter [Nitrospinota bacterium]|nr:transporter [Nitrospinota bacterium]
MKILHHNLIAVFLKRPVQALIFLLVSGLVVPSASLAYLGLCCAHCGGNMPLNIPGAGIPEPKEFRFKLSQMIMSMGPMRSGTTNLSEGSLLTGPGSFMAVPSAMQMHMTMLGGAYSFTDDFALMAMTSYKFNRMQMEFGGMLQGMTGEAGFTMESRGMGDIKLLGKYRLYIDDHLAPKDQFSALFGVSLPSGSIDKKFRNSPVANQNGTLLPFKMQMGSGTFDPMIGLAYQASQDPWWYGATALYTARVYDNNRGYQQGDEFRLDLYGLYQFHETSVVHLQLNGMWEDRYSDEPDAGRLGQGHMMSNPALPFASPLFDPANYGGKKLSVTAGIQWQPLPMNVLELTGSVPVYQDLRGPQLKEDFRVMLSWYIELPTKHSRRHTGTEPPKELGF